MKRLEKLALQYNFDFGFVTDFNGDMQYDDDKLFSFSATKTNPQEFLKECKTVVVLAFKYDNNSSFTNLAANAWGEDYHIRIKRIGKELTPLFENGKIYVDSHRLNEKFFAQKSGIGYVGKNNLFISDKYGSYCNLALLLTTEEITLTKVNSNSCGSCTKCIDACPTSAIDGIVDCNKCVSAKLQKKDIINFDGITNIIYGCDICQEVCPKNELDDYYSTKNSYIDIASNLDLKKEHFSKYRNYGFAWIGYEVFMRNIHYIYAKENRDVTKLEFLETSESEYLKTIAKTIKGVIEND